MPQECPCTPASTSPFSAETTRFDAECRHSMGSQVSQGQAPQPSLVAETHLLLQAMSSACARARALRCPVPTVAGRQPQQPSTGVFGRSIGHADYLHCKRRQRVRVGRRALLDRYAERNSRAWEAHFVDGPCSDREYLYLAPWSANRKVLPARHCGISPPETPESLRGSVPYEPHPQPPDMSRAVSW